MYHKILPRDISSASENVPGPSRSPLARQAAPQPGGDGGYVEPMEPLWKWWCNGMLPFGKHTKNYGKSPFFMGKSTISMAIFNSYVRLPKGNGILTNGILMVNDG